MLLFTPHMQFDDFQHLARLYVVGALDEEEMASLEEGRRTFGRKADDYIAECRQLESVFALSLTPRKPDSDAKAKLLAKILKGERN
jgi:hypothetical protein